MYFKKIFFKTRNNFVTNKMKSILKYLKILFIFSFINIKYLSKWILYSDLTVSNRKYKAYISKKAEKIQLNNKLCE